MSVVGFLMWQEFMRGDSQHAIIPLSEFFQLPTESDTEGFSRRVYYSVAQAFIEHHEQMRNRGLNVPNVAQVRYWLQAPVSKGLGAGLNVGPLGGQASWARTASGSGGFLDAGFEQTVKSWLRQCFPARESGGFLCVIDNLELLETSTSASRVLEAIRDDLLLTPGLRWVLAGARGVVRTSASTPRLEGRLTKPLELEPLKMEDIDELLEKRVSHFGVTNSARPPVAAPELKLLYGALNKNLRNTLSYAEEHAMWLSDAYPFGLEPDENYTTILIEWLMDLADDIEADARLSPGAKLHFDTLVKMGGRASLSDLAIHSKDKTVRKHADALRRAQLIGVEIDEADRRRKNLKLTPKGWLLAFRENASSFTLEL